MSKATKTGMLANRSTVDVVATCIDELDVPSVVVDPVIVSTSGRRLLDADAVEALRDNAAAEGPLYHAEPTGGRADRWAAPLTRSPTPATPHGESSTLAAGAVVVTGGHLPTEEVIDILFDGHDLIEFSGPRLIRAHTHGSGCTFSAAITAALARNQSLAERSRGREVLCLRGDPTRVIGRCRNQRPRALPEWHIQWSSGGRSAAAPVSMRRARRG